MKNALIFSVILAVLGSGCSKSITRAAGVFSQTEPSPTPTEPSPTEPSPTPTPVPVPTSIGCEPGALGDLPTYAIYTKEDLKLSKVTVGKRVAASDADIYKALLGYTLARKKARTDLATVYDLDLRSTQVVSGNATFGKRLHTKRSSAYGGISEAPFSMLDGFRTLSEFSNACARTEANTTLVRTCSRLKICTLHIRGSDPFLNIAELTEADLAGIHVLRIEVPARSTLVANIPALRTKIFKAVAVVFPKGKTRPTLYWNFPDAESLSFQKTLFHGTVIAPEADVKVHAQVGEAGFWTRKLSGSGAAWW